MSKNGKLRLKEYQRKTAEIMCHNCAEDTTSEDVVMVAGEKVHKRCKEDFLSISQRFNSSYN